MRVQPNSIHGGRRAQSLDLGVDPYAIMAFAEERPIERLGDAQRDIGHLCCKSDLN